MLMIDDVMASIYRTDCKKFIKEGFFCSDPIITKDENGLIDNFFIYAANRDESLVTPPIVSFGIYAEIKKTAYVKQGTKEPKAQENPKELLANKRELRNKYSGLYSEIREFVFKDCNSDQAQMLQEYISSLKALVGQTLWTHYQSTSPMFFNWAKKFCEI